MSFKENIYRLRALTILLVFGISLLPRQVIHNFLTSHKHVKFSGHPGQAQLSTETFTCSPDNLFLQQSYTDTTEDLSFSRTFAGHIKAKKLISFHDSDDRRITALRGPPVSSPVVYL